MSQSITSMASASSVTSILGPSVSTQAYLRQLTVQNTRCFGPLEQSLNLCGHDGNPAKWNLVLGENGTGKTTLLWCIAIFSSRPTLLSGETCWSPRGKSIFGPGDKIWESLLRDGISEKMPQRIRLAYSPALGDPSQTHLAEFERRGKEVLAVEYPMSLGVQVNAYAAWRRLQASVRLMEADLDLADPADNIFNYDAGLLDATDWLTRLDYASRVDSEFSERQRVRLKEVKDVLKRLLIGVDEIRFSAPKSEDGIPTPEFKTVYGWVPLSSLSNGYQSMISWVVDFAARLFHRYPESPDPLAEPAVCLIDEIDLHLHPRWQREIMSYLSERFPKTQFIATAHSPLIVQAAESVDANVVVLRREEDHVIIDNHPQSVKGWRVDQILSSDLFGVGPWPPRIQQQMNERRDLLAKSMLSNTEQSRLMELDQELKSLPVGETPEQIEMMHLLQKSLQALPSSQASES